MGRKEENLWVVTSFGEAQVDRQDLRLSLPKTSSGLHVLPQVQVTMLHSDRHG
jgi:hypothetical protein